jgi:hypothetical protein
VSNHELADTIAAQTGRRIKRSIIPWGVLSAATASVGLVNHFIRDLGRMFLFFRTGKYVADGRAHEELLGPLPTKDDAIGRWAHAKGLVLR